MPSTIVWYCSSCGDGPLNPRIDVFCPMCRSIIHNPRLEIDASEKGYPPRFTWSNESASHVPPTSPFGLPPAHTYNGNTGSAPSDGDINIDTQQSTTLRLQDQKIPAEEHEGPDLTGQPTERTLSTPGPATETFTAPTLPKESPTPQEPVISRRERGHRSARAVDFRHTTPDCSPIQESPSVYCQNYATRVADSNDFAFIWERSIIPFLLQFLPKLLRSPPGRELDESYSADVFTGSTPQTKAFWYIHVTTAQEVSLPWRIVIAERIIQLLPVPYRQTTKFHFFNGRIERIPTCQAHGFSKERPDYMCAPVRPHYEKVPSIGASIGAEGNETATGTFGGRLLIQHKQGHYTECFMTCNHLFYREDSEGDDEDSNYDTTNEVEVVQPSPQEAVLLRQHIEENEELIRNNPEVSDHHILLWRRQIKCWKAVLNGFPSNLEDMRLGYLLASSGYRTREYGPLCGKEQIPLEPAPDGLEARVEVDWAIGVINPLKSGDNVIPPTRKEKWHTTKAAEASPMCLEAGDFKGGAEVYAIGRTSGRQRGRISEAPSLIKLHDKYHKCYNREWAVLQHEEDEDECEWVSGGMALPGDSGSWVLGKKDNVLHGLIWARNNVFGDGPRTALFTPILLVFDDIHRTLGSPIPKLPQPTTTNVDISSKIAQSPLPAPLPMETARSSSWYDGGRDDLDDIFDAMPESSERIDSLDDLLATELDIYFAEAEAQSLLRNDQDAGNDSLTRSSTRSRARKGVLVPKSRNRDVDSFRTQRLGI